MTTFKELAEYFGITYQTVSNWSKKKPLIYKAMREYYEKQNKG